MILILLSHYDDEIFLLPQIKTLKEEILVVYLTDSAYPNWTTPRYRQMECQRSWRILHSTVTLNFFGFDNNIRDGRLHLDFDSRHTQELIRLLPTNDITQIWALSPEGGHQDHDFTFAIANHVSTTLGRSLSHYPAYRLRTKPKFPGFDVMSSRQDCSCERISSDASAAELLILFLKLVIFAYPSQVKTWFALGPFVIKTFLVSEHKEHSCPQTYSKNCHDYLWFRRKRANHSEFIARLGIFQSH